VLAPPSICLNKHPQQKWDSTSMRDSGILAIRLTLGSYLAVHGAQKLFGTFDGPGLDNAAVGFEHMGLKPGKPFATLAATSELVGGVLTATGVAWPAGPVAIAGAMAVATSVHWDAGPMGQKGGYELPLTDMVVALGLAIIGPGRYRLGPHLPRGLTRLTALGATAMSAYSISKVMANKKSAAAAPAPGAAELAAEPEPDTVAEEVLP
jgi:putative oxidoreductase